MKENKFGLPFIILIVFIYTLLSRDSRLGIILSSFIKIIQPILYGFSIAYLINPVVNMVSKKLNINNGWAILIVYSSIFLVAISLIVWLSPKVLSFSKENVYLLYDFSLIEESIAGFLPETIYSRLNSISSIFDVRSVLPELNADAILIFSTKAKDSLVNSFFGVVISIYMIKEKDKFRELFKKILFAFMPKKEDVYFVLNIGKEIDLGFSKFVTGTIIESIVLSILSFVFLSIVGINNVLLFSVLFGVLNVIPYLGPTVGVIIISVFTFFTFPGKVVLVLVGLLVLQQVDGIYLKPVIIGKKAGLSPFWTMTSILVFGGALGIPGMIMAVPISSALKKILILNINKRLKMKGFSDSDLIERE